MKRNFENYLNQSYSVILSGTNENGDFFRKHWPTRDTHYVCTYYVLYIQYYCPYKCTTVHTYTLIWYAPTCRALLFLNFAQGSVTEHRTPLLECHELWGEYFMGETYRKIVRDIDPWDSVCFRRESAPPLEGSTAPRSPSPPDELSGPV